ncbi:hypothetical protein [Labilithrix luteola]|nr:hypothetical protein [Labilithrix luteola]
MKLVRALSVFGFGLVGLVGVTATAFSAGGCSSSDSSTGGGGSTGQPPSKPEGAAVANPADTRTFAVSQLFLGDTDRNGTTDPSAWKKFGYNIDGLTTAKTSTDVCTRQGGATADKQEDGDDGRDDGFHTVMTFINGIVPKASSTISKSIADDGAFTIIFDLKGLNDDAHQTATGLSGNLLIGADLAKKPDFGPSLDWPYHADPTVAISDAYINNGTFVNGTGGSTVKLSIAVQGQNLTLNINHAIITFDHSSPDELTNGTIAGVLATEELVTGITNIASSLTDQLCSGSMLETVLQTIRQASDILQDGSNHAGIPCDGIAIGLGFNAHRIGPPKTVAPPSTSTPQDKCKADGGT